MSKNLNNVLECVSGVKDICDNLLAIKGEKFVQKVQIVHSLYSLSKMADKAIDKTDPIRGAMFSFALDNVTAMVIKHILADDKEAEDVLEWAEVIEKRLNS